MKTNISGNLNACLPWLLKEVSYGCDIYMVKVFRMTSTFGETYLRVFELS